MFILFRWSTEGASSYFRWKFSFNPFPSCLCNNSFNLPRKLEHSPASSCKLNKYVLGENYLRLYNPWMAQKFTFTFMHMKTDLLLNLIKQIAVKTFIVKSGWVNGRNQDLNLSDPNSLYIAIKVVIVPIFNVSRDRCDTMCRYM